MERNTKGNGIVANVKTPPPTPTILWYTNPAGTEYPVIAYNDVALPSGSNTTSQQLQELLRTVRDCGFNVNLWANGDCGNQTLLKSYFRIAYNLGLRTVMNISSYMPIIRHVYNGPNMPVGMYYKPSLEDLASFLNLYKENSNLWGYMFLDEPVYNNWAPESMTQNAGTIDLLPAYHTYLQNKNNHVAFFNLAVTSHENVIGSELANSNLTFKQKYFEYLKEFNEKVKPLMMSVDLYPIIKVIKENSSDAYFIKSFYYSSMDAIGEFSTEFQKPFWLYLLSNKHKLYQYVGESLKEVDEYPFPSVGILRYQAMTALAFGIQGLVFWTYGKRENTKNSYGKLDTEFLNAPYEDGHTTEVWNNCKEVIQEIKLYGAYLLNAKFKGSRHVYGSLSGDPYSDTTKFSAQFGCVSGANASGTGFVITHLENGSANYMAIVSHDAFNEQNITLYIPIEYKWQQLPNALPVDDNSKVEASLEKASPNIGISQVINRKLEAGGIILISYWMQSGNQV